MMVLGEYVCDIPATGVKAFSHRNKNSIISMKICTGNSFNSRVLHVSLARFFITLICCSIYGTYSASAVVLRVDLFGVILLIFSNSLSIYNISTYTPRLY